MANQTTEISLEIFLGFCQGILEKRPYQGIKPEDVPRMVRLGIAEGYYFNNQSLKRLKQRLKPVDLKEIEFSNALVQSRQAELKKLIKWLLPMLPIARKTSIQYSVVVRSAPGQGNTKCFHELYNALTQITPRDMVHQFDEHGYKNRTKTYKRSSVVLLDSMGDYEGYSSDLSHVVFASTAADFQKVNDLLPRPVLNFDLPSLTPDDIVEILAQEYSHDGNEIPVFREDIEKMISGNLSPKDILTSIRVATSITEHESGRPNTCDRSILYKTSERIGAPNVKPMPISEVESYLLSKVYGQDEVIKSLVLSIAAYEYGMSRGNRPIISALYVGPSGTGKTLLAETLAEVLFGHNEIVRVDMSEFSERHTATKLFGAPPGYIGHNEDTKFVQEIKRLKQTVILFDEIEKAAREVHTALLHLLDAGKFSTAKSETIDITNCVIIMTSNSIAKELGRGKMGFTSKGEEEFTSDETRSELSKAEFPVEFINRVDLVSRFNSLSDDAAASIAIRELENTKQAFLSKGIKFTYNKSLVKRITKTYNKEYGGRDVVRKVQDVRKNAINEIVTTINNTGSQPDNVKAKL